MSSAAIDALEEPCRAAISRHRGVAVVYLFGSIARGTERIDSDVDLGVVYARGVDDRTHDRVAADLASAAGRALGRELVDIVDLAAQGPVFAHRAIGEGVRLVILDEKRRVDFESDTIVRALDFLPTHELATRGKATALRRWLREQHDLRGSSVEA